MIKNIFWNPIESRVRFGWRMAGQTVLIFVPVVILNIALQPLAEQGVIKGVTLNSPPGMFRLSFVILVGAIFSVWLAGRFLDHRHFADFGFRFDRNWWIDFGFGLALGAILSAAIFGIEWAAGWITITGVLQGYDGTPFGQAILMAVVTFICVGIYEELIFRGYHLKNIAEWLNQSKRVTPRWAVLGAVCISSMFFGISHTLNPNATVLSTLNIALGSIFLLGIGFFLTSELAISIGVHIAFNLFRGSVFGFGVSGFDARATTLIVIEQGGPAWLTGGAFGPEAGPLGLAAMLLGGILTLGWVKWRRGNVTIQESIAEPPTLSQQ